MKKIAILLITSLSSATLCAANTTNAQDTIIKSVTTITETDPETGVIRTTTTETETTLPTIKEMPKSEVISDGASYSFIFSWKKKKYLNPHWTGFGMSFMNFAGKNIPNSNLIASKSYAFSLNLFEYSIPIKNSNWIFVTGGGFDWFRYHFDDNVALTKVDGVTQLEPAPDGINYKSSKLLSYYITIPLLLEYQLPVRNKNIYISGGAVGFIKYYSKSQVKYYDTEGHKRIDDKGRDLNLRPIDLKLRLQIGFGDFSAFAYYSPFSMFEKDKGPDLKTYNIGLMMGF